MSNSKLLCIATNHDITSHPENIVHVELNHNFKQEQSETALYARMPEPVNALLVTWARLRVLSRSQWPDSNEMWTQYTSCNLLNIHTNVQVGISKSILTTIQKSTGSRDSLYKCVYKIWRIYLNWWSHKCRRRPFLCLPRTPLTGDKIIVTLVYLGKMSPSHQGWIKTVLIWTLILPIVVQ